MVFFGKNPKLLKRLLLEIFKEYNPTIEYELMESEPGSEIFVHS